jgi:peptide/nickel transport system ATP-binding protein
MGLLPPPGRIISGEVNFKGTNLLKLSHEEMSDIRGKKISMIFQDPRTYLNPVMKAGEQILEVMIRHQLTDTKKAKRRVIELLKKVNIPSPEAIIDYYPFQLSGGMCQRIMIAIAIACNPDLLIADEPTTALDVTVQAQILELLKGLKEDLGMSLLLITHDIGIVARYCEKIYIMYAGKMVEGGDILEVFDTPLHPYTRGLLECVLSIDEKREYFPTIDGHVPEPINMVECCRYYTRCGEVQEICRKKSPPSKEVEPNHQVACWLYS